MNPARPVTRYGIEICDRCGDCKWRGDSFFCQFDEKILEAFNGVTYTNVYPSGTLLYAEGEQPRGLFILCEGAAKLTISSGTGKTLIVRMVQPGDALGLPSVLKGTAYKTSAETTAHSQLKFVRRDDFLRFAEEHRAVSFNIARQLVDDCESDADQIRALGLTNTAAERLAQLLLLWCDESGRPSASGMRIPVPMTHEEISQMIGTSRETVTRLLKSFREKKLISVRRASMTVHNKSELEDLLLP
ncbi:MAG TPA: Crp/Fnr family transcriptional regulator [Thermoanaerobaculia bacterium]|nr:Crp/Fnr family transcriptional regulator [Thermoanaerobaculia bacterium]